jgi:hypothetical protein
MLSPRLTYLTLLTGKTSVMFATVSLRGEFSKIVCQKS